MAKKQPDRNVFLRPTKRDATQNFVLVIHGGAGTMDRLNSTPEQRAKYRTELARALKAGHQVLKLGGEAMDAAVAAVAVMEDCPLFNAGKGAVFNVAGKNELEASLMLSKPPASHPAMPSSRRGSSVALLTRTKNPSHLVRALYLAPSFAPHPMLSGTTAESIGAVHFSIQTVDPSYFWTEARWRQHRIGLGLPVEPIDPPHYDDVPDTKSQPQPERETVLVSDGNSQKTNVDSAGGEEKSDKHDQPIDLMPAGTVGAVALDIRGCIAVVTSTGGKTNKLVGRVGDTPIMGSGFWAEEWQRKSRWLESLWEHFASARARDVGVGVSGTGDGDYFIRQNTASMITRRMQYLDESLEKAAKHTVEDLFKMGGSGGVVAVDKQGNVALSLNSDGMYRGVIRADGVALTAIFVDDELSEL